MHLYTILGLMLRASSAFQGLLNIPELNKSVNMAPKEAESLRMGHLLRIVVRFLITMIIYDHSDWGILGQPFGVFLENVFRLMINDQIIRWHPICDGQLVVFHVIVPWIRHNSHHDHSVPSGCWQLWA